MNEILFIIEKIIEKTWSASLMPVFKRGCDESLRFKFNELGNFYKVFLINTLLSIVRWCVGRNKFWRAWIRCMLLIPAVILPIVIIFIALSRSTVVGTLSLHQPTDKST